MGEEKPEEELMGKRKSSPRLSTTRDTVLLISILSRAGKKYTLNKYLIFIGKHFNLPWPVFVLPC